MALTGAVRHACGIRPRNMRQVSEPNNMHKFINVQNALALLSNFNDTGVSVGLKKLQWLSFWTTASGHLQISITSRR